MAPRELQFRSESVSFSAASVSRLPKPILEPSWLVLKRLGEASGPSLERFPDVWGVSGTFWGGVWALFARVWRSFWYSGAF